MRMIVVTGASGRLGRRVAARLSKEPSKGLSNGLSNGLSREPSEEQRVRLVVRDPAKAPAGEVAVADHSDGEAVRRALDGAHTVFMVSAAESEDRVARHRTFVDAAVAAGVGHLVYTSFVGAAEDAVFTLARDHWATEEHIRASGLPFTFLRDNLYADFLPQLVGADGVIRGPAGEGRAAVVAQDDIADAAVAVLRDPAAHAGRTYDLTGPDAVSMAEVAEAVGARFHDESLPEAYESRARYQAPRWQVDAWVSTYTSIASGELAGVSGDVTALAGRPATPLRDVLARRLGD